MSDKKPTPGSIDFTRIDPDSVDSCCILCGMRPVPEYATHLIITFWPLKGDMVDEIMLCPEHEVLLMEKMINNWEKRKNRGNRANPIAWPIYKEEEKADEAGNDANHPNAG